MADQKLTMAHTPGPWEVGKDGNFETALVSQCGIVVAFAAWDGGSLCHLEIENPADAALITSAPDLAAAARNALEVFLTVRMYFGDGSLGRAEIDDSIGQIKAAIAKATGEQP